MIQLLNLDLLYFEVILIVIRN
eukprot:SAG31_NODE_16538_length_705_cov_0.858086_1_plen_21_part_10